MSVYLDNAATTAIDPIVVEAMLPYLTEHFGNPSSTHAHGRKVKATVEQCRKRVAELLGISPAEVYFTSGGTESDNTALRCAVRDRKISHVISAPTEHHAVLHTLQELHRAGLAKLHMLEVDPLGDIDFGQLEQLLKTYPGALVSLMHGNNEIGNLLDLVRVGELCKAYGAYFHSDTVQTIGHFPINLGALPVHAIAASAHKFHGPKGIGLLYLRKDAKLCPLITGGSQEREMRGGTENIYGVVGLAKALEIAVQHMETHRAHIEKLKARMQARLVEKIPGVAFNGRSGELDNSLFTVLSVSLPEELTHELLLFQLDLKGVSVSGGSACSSGAAEGSHVMRAIKPGNNRGTIRFSFSKYNTEAEIDFAVDQLFSICEPRIGQLKS